MVDILSLALYNRCRSLLLTCDEFQSNESVRRVFAAGGLGAYRDLIPEAINIEDRVDDCLDLLQRRRWGGKSVLVMFLEGLSSRYPKEDDLHCELDKLIQDVSAALVQSTAQSAQPARPTFTLDVVTQPLPQNEEPPSLEQILFNEVLEIDFDDQVQMVDDILKEHPVAAFLIHADPTYGPNCGQRVLIERLFYLWNEDNEGDEWDSFTLNIGSPGVWAGIPTLWHRIADYFGLPPNTRPEQIVDAIYRSWKTKNIVFIFYQIDYLVNKVPTFLAQWIQQFWQEVVAKIQAEGQLKVTDTSTQPNHLLLFLVDFNGRMCYAEDVCLAEEGNDNRYPAIPLRLPPNQTFSPDILKLWLRRPLMRALRPKGVVVDPQQLWIESLSGIPELVYRQIFHYYRLSWEGTVKKWLT